MAKRNTVELPFPPPHWEFSRWQRDVWDETGADLHRPRRILMCAGRGSGKDVLAIRCALRDAFKLYSQKIAAERKLVLNPLVKIWILAPSDNALSQTLDDFRGELDGLQKAWGLGDGALYREVVRDRTIWILGENQIGAEYRITSRKDSLRGPGVDVCLYTELKAEYRPAAWYEELQGTLNRAGRLGRVYGYSTPGGPAGLFWDECKKVMGEGIPAELEERLTSTANTMVKSPNNLEMYVHADSLQNDFLSPEQREAILAEAGDSIYEQERLARFVILDVGGSPVYEREWLEKILVGEIPKIEDCPNVIVGVDVSRLGSDFTTFVPVDFDSGCVLRVERYQKTTGPDILAHMERLNQEFGFPEFIMDETAHQAFLKDFAPRSLRITGMRIGSDRDKERLVFNLRHLIQVGRTKVPDPKRARLSKAEKENFEKLIEETLHFQKIVTNTGTVRYDHPPGGHDDSLAGWTLAVDPIARSMRGTLDGKKVVSKVSKLL